MIIEIHAHFTGTSALSIQVQRMNDTAIILMGTEDTYHSWIDDFFFKSLQRKESFDLSLSPSI